MEQRAAHRAPGHPVGRHAKRLGSAAITAALFALPLASAAPAQASVSTQWPLQTLKASQVWSVAKGSGATVAVLDTGVESLPDTEATLLTGADFGSGTTSTGSGQTDLDGHGTGIAVIIAGSGASVAEGLAPDAKILPVIINDTGGILNQPDQMAAGIDYAVSQHVSVINLSQSIGQDPSVATAIQQAVDANIVVVAASGNESASNVDYPAAYPGVVAVSAVDESGSIWSNSNTGAQVTLAAPGVNVPTEDETGSAGTATGTSASTAYVSATAALIRSEHPSWTVGQVIRDLIATADPASGQTAGQHSDQYGYGIVDPLKAVDASAPTQTTNPLLTSTAATASATASSSSTGSGTSSGASSSSSGTGLIIGVVIGAILFIGVILLIVLIGRRNKNRPGGPGSGNGPGGGSPYGGPGQYPQQNPYQQQQNPGQQQNPYGQPQYPYPQQGQQPPQR